MSVRGELNLADFYSADAEVLLAKYRQIEHLIGLSHHSASEGSYCETLLKEFLRRTLPRQVSVDGGFIRRVTDGDWSSASGALAPDAPIATPQLDIIIHDTQNYAPLLRSEDFVVVLPEAVRGVIEVKKRLDHTKLTESLQNIATTSQLLRKWRHEAHRVFMGIFAFDLADSLNPDSKPHSDSFKNCFQRTLDDYGGDCELPDLLMVLPSLAFQRDSNPKRYNYCPTTPDGALTPNVALQFLVFVICYFTSIGTQSRALDYPEDIKKRRSLAFELQMP